MNTPRLELGGTAILAVAGLAVAGLVAWRVYRQAGQAAAAVGELWDSAAGAVDQGLANLQSAVVNTFSFPPEPGEKAFLYSDESYTGIDPYTGESVLSGARADEEFRRYEYQQRDAGNAPAATSNAGAAFGIYPSSGRRRP